jgi:hypothetical protein
MNVYLGSGYGDILLLWGLIFELVGLGIVVLINRAIRQDEQRMDRAVRAERSDVERRSRGARVPPATTGARR